MADSNTTEKLCDLIRSRAEVGMAKYGVSLDRTDLKLSDWLEHSIQERLDDLGYMLRAKETAIELEALRQSVRRLVGEFSQKRDEADKALNDAYGAGNYNQVHNRQGYKEAMTYVWKELSALIDGKGQSEAPQAPIKYTGHPYCHKCGKSHWMYAECETTNPRER